MGIRILTYAVFCDFCGKQAEGGCGLTSGTAQKVAFNSRFALGVNKSCHNDFCRHVWSCSNNKCFSKFCKIIRME